MGCEVVQGVFEFLLLITASLTSLRRLAPTQPEATPIALTSSEKKRLGQVPQWNYLSPDPGANTCLNSNVLTETAYDSQRVSTQEITEFSSLSLFLWEWYPQNTPVVYTAQKQLTGLSHVWNEDLHLEVIPLPYTWSRGLLYEAWIQLPRRSLCHSIHNHYIEAGGKCKVLTYLFMKTYNQVSNALTGHKSIPSEDISRRRNFNRKGDITWFQASAGG
jgi:hypothetical protein